MILLNKLINSKNTIHSVLHIFNFGIHRYIHPSQFDYKKTTYNISNIKYIINNILLMNVCPKIN